MPTYQYGKLIGQGGFGEVYEARRIDDGWVCVIKRLKSDATEREKARFRREVRIQAKLHYKNIVRIVGLNLDDDPPWFVMPRALFSLKDYLLTNRGEDNIWIVHHIAAGLDYAHKNKIVHRDVKPANILFFQDEEGKLYASLCDFGAGKFLERDTPPITQSDAGVGTPQYMAPEQFREARDVDQRADVFALGKILYEILTGDMPYPDMDLSKVPNRFEYIVRKACNYKCDDRYQNISEFLNDLVTVTEKRQLFTRPAEQLRLEMQKVFDEQDYSAERIRIIARILAENKDDQVILTDMLPKLPEAILCNLLQHHTSDFLIVLLAYDEIVSEALPFKYCDVVADFYYKIFSLTDNQQIREMVLKRLPQVGHNHNRWYVGKVFAGIVSQLTDENLILLVRDILGDDQARADWCKKFLEEYSLPQLIKDAVRQ